MRRVVAIVLSASIVLSSCALVESTPGPSWRREDVIRIVFVDELPRYVDLHCISVTHEHSARPRAVVVRFRVGHAYYYQAFDASPDFHWRIGDLAQFVSSTCQIVRISSRQT